MNKFHQVNGSGSKNWPLVKLIPIRALVDLGSKSGELKSLGSNPQRCQASVARLRKYRWPLHGIALEVGAPPIFLLGKCRCLAESPKPDVLSVQLCAAQLKKLETKMVQLTVQLTPLARPGHRRDFPTPA